MSNKLTSIIVQFLCCCLGLDCSLVTGPDEGGGAPARLQPSGTLLVSEEDVVEGGWAPTPSFSNCLLNSLLSFSPFFLSLSSLCSLSQSSLFSLSSFLLASLPSLLSLLINSLSSKDKDFNFHSFSLHSQAPLACGSSALLSPLLPMGHIKRT